MAGRGADRTRRYTPKGTYFGIVEADENGYRREAILGNVEHKFSVDPLLVYPLDKDPYNLVAVQPAGNLDWDTTLKALNDNGFIGFRIDDKQIGKVAFINQPLILDEVVDQTPREKPQTKDIQTKKIAPVRSIDPAQKKLSHKISKKRKGAPLRSFTASKPHQRRSTLHATQKRRLFLMRY